MRPREKEAGGERELKDRRGRRRRIPEREGEGKGGREAKGWISGGGLPPPLTPRIQPTDNNDDDDEVGARMAALAVLGGALEEHVASLDVRLPPTEVLIILLLSRTTLHLHHVPHFERDLLLGVLIPHYTSDPPSLQNRFA